MNRHERRATAAAAPPDPNREAQRLLSEYVAGFTRLSNDAGPGLALRCLVVGFLKNGATAEQIRRVVEDAIVEAARV